MRRGHHAPHEGGIVVSLIQCILVFFFAVPPLKKVIGSPIQPKRVLKFGDSGMLKT